MSMTNEKKTELNVGAFVRGDVLRSNSSTAQPSENPVFEAKKLFGDLLQHAQEIRVTSNESCQETFRLIMTPQYLTYSTKRESEPYEIKLNFQVGSISENNIEQPLSFTKEFLKTLSQISDYLTQDQATVHEILDSKRGVD